VWAAAHVDARRVLDPDDGQAVAPPLRDELVRLDEALHRAHECLHRHIGAHSPWRASHQATLAASLAVVRNLHALTSAELFRGGRYYCFLGTTQLVPSRSARTTISFDCDTSPARSVTV